MKVVTPMTKLDVRINDVKAEDGLLVMDGVAGMMQCKTSLTPAEFRQMMRPALRPSVLVLLFKKQALAGLALARPRCWQPARCLDPSPGASAVATPGTPGQPPSQG